MYLRWDSLSKLLKGGQSIPYGQLAPFVGLLVGWLAAGRGELIENLPDQGFR